MAERIKMVDIDRKVEICDNYATYTNSAIERILFDEYFWSS